MKTAIAVFFLAAASVVAATATEPTTGQAAPTTAERVTQLEAELSALSKENDLLSDTLANNWDYFKTRCGAVLTTKCAEVAKQSEKFVDVVEKKESCILQHGREECDEEIAAFRDAHKGNVEQEGKPERSLRGDGHHDGKQHRSGKHHRDGKHHRGGKHHQERGPPPVAQSVQCVLKQSVLDKKSVPAHCVRSAKRFGMYLNLHRHAASAVFVMAPPPHSGAVHFFVFLFQVLLLCALIGCCCKCARRMRNKRCPVQQQQSAQTAQIVLGQPVVLTTAVPTSNAPVKI